MAMGLASGGSRRRGRRRRRRGRISEINVTPFVDVMLVLLIVFMVTAPLLTAGVPVELPRTAARQLPTEAEPLTVTVRADGSVYLQDTAIREDELVGRLQAIAREGYDRRIFIRGDTSASYGRVLAVMAMLNSAGYTNLGLVSDPMSAPRPARTAP